MEDEALVCVIEEETEVEAATAELETARELLAAAAEDVMEA